MDDKYKTKSVWGETPAGTAFAENLQPGTKEFFEEVIKIRSSYEMPWLFEIVPFHLFTDRKVLEIGCGAGYDAYEFCRHGADYVGIDLVPENIQRTKAHLEFYGYSPELFEGDAENLEFEDGSFDVVFSNGVLHHTPCILKSFSEAFRVLNTGGEFWVTVYHRDSIFYWLTVFLCEYILRLGFLKRSFKERLSMIEYTKSQELPLVNAYSRKQIKDLLRSEGFAVEKLWIRKLVKEDLPSIPAINRLWRLVPQKLLDFVGKYLGWYIIVKAKKV